jgi:hypothetical protein
MQLAVGAYFLEVNAADIKAYSETMRNRGGQPYSVKQRLEITAYLSGTGQQDITNKLNLLIVALAAPYQDVILYQDSGAISATFLRGIGSISGVVVTKGPEFLDNTGAEYTNFRKFHFAAESEIPLGNSANLLNNFTEHLKFRGGGQKRIFMESINAPPQPQITKLFTTYEAWQIGEAEGYLKRPELTTRTIPPLPIWPLNLIEQNPELDVATPKLMGKGYQDYKTTWNYHFQSATPLIGLPNLWIP